LDDTDLVVSDAAVNNHCCFGYEVKGVLASIKAIVNRVGDVAQNMSFNVRLPVSHDELGAISVGFNDMLEGVEKSVADINRVTHALAVGDFSQRITDSYTGDLAMLKTTVNTSVDNIATVMHHLTQTTSALQSGQFSHDVQVNCSGEYGKMLNDLEQTMSTLNQIINEINEVMHQVSMGVFESKRPTAPYLILG
jgi:methyl-accepting chemotaxis protein